MGTNNQANLDTWLKRTTPSAVSHSVQKPSDSSSPSHQSTSDRRQKLRQVARETLNVLPSILAQLPPHVLPRESTPHSLSSLGTLHPLYCPRFPPTKIRVLDSDTFNAAISLAALPTVASTTTTTTAAAAAAATGRTRPGNGRVAVLNMASHARPGGGWLNGALAQEEALCYRSSLSLSLHGRYYPWRQQRMGLYTEDVVIVRSDLESGHRLLMAGDGMIAATDLPVVSVISIAAVNRPATKTVSIASSAGQRRRKEVYADPEVRAVTKDKMRLCLRLAGRKGHRRLVLGALGCGAFKNPKEEVANCWREVLDEPEFQGGWWEYVVFAVLDKRGEGNIEVFEQVLGGKEV